MSAESPPRPGAARRILSWVLLVGGATLLVALIRRVGVDAVLRACADAGPYLPLIVVLDACWFAGESGSHRALLGADAKRVPLSVLVRGTAAGYVALVLLPLGRVSAEVARAAPLAGYVPPARIAAAGVNMQAVSLLGNMLVSLPCALAVGSVLGASHLLTLFVIGNAVVTGVGGLGLLLVLRRTRVGVALGKRLPWLVPEPSTGGEALKVERSSLVRATAIAFAARLAQTAQYGLILFAVGGTLGVGSAFFSQGVHLVAAAVGDLVPSQLGVLEGAFHLSASYLGFAADPARAVSIALLARASSLILATTTLTLLVATSARSPRALERT